MRFLNHLFKGEGSWGLDISDFSLKIVSFRRPGFFSGRNALDFRVSGFTRRDIPPGIIKEGVIKDEKKLAGIIKEAILDVKGENLFSRSVIVSLPEQEAFIRLIETPVMTEQELRGAIPYEAEADIPLSLEKMYLDWKVVPRALGDQNKHMDVLIGALPRQIVDDYLSLLKGLGLTVQAMEIESFATARSLIFGGYSPEPILIVDLGSGRTSFIIFAGRAPRFTTSLPISGEKMIEVIAQKTGSDRAKARRLKYEHGLSGDKEGVEVVEALAPILNELAEQIGKFINFYENHKHTHGSAANVTKIILCGGGANLAGLDSWLSTVLKLPVEISDPWINVYRPWSNELPIIPYKDSLQYATAIGLALLGARR